MLRKADLLSKRAVEMAERAGSTRPTRVVRMGPTGENRAGPCGLVITRFRQTETGDRAR